MLKAIYNKFTGRSRRFLSKIAKQWDAPQRGTEHALKAYNDSPWVHAVVSRVAGEIANTCWMTFNQSRGRVALPMVPSRRFVGRKGMAAGPKGWQPQDKGGGSLLDSVDLVEIDHDVLKLLENPNPVHTGYQFMYLTVVHMLCGAEAFWMIERDESGKPIELWIQSPHWIKDTPTPDKNRFVVRKNLFSEEVAAEDMIWIKRPKADDPYGRGSGPVRALAAEIDTDEAASVYLYNFMQNGGVPSMLIGVDDATEDEVEAAKAKYMAEHSGSGQSQGVFFYSGDLKVQQLNNTFKEMQMVELRRFQRDATFQVLGMPPELLGVIENANRSTIDLADYLFARRVLMPILMELWWTVQFRLMPQFNDQAIFSFISPVPDDHELLIRIGTAVPDTWTINEWREFAGKPPIEGGDEMYVPITYSSSLEDSADKEGGEEEIDEEVKILIEQAIRRLHGH